MREPSIRGFAGAKGNDETFHGFLLGSIGNDYPALLAFVLFLFDRFHEDPITQWSNI